MKLEFPLQIFEECSNINCMTIRPVGAELFHVDIRTDRTQIIVDFLIFRTRLKMAKWRGVGIAQSVGRPGYGLDGPGAPIRAGAIRPDRPWGPFILLLFAGRKRSGRYVDHTPSQAPRLRMSGAIPLLLLHAVMARTRTTLLVAFTLMTKRPTKLYCFCRIRRILI